MNPIRIMLVDDHVSMRQQVEALLGGDAELTVIAEAGSAEEALDMDRKLHPDVVVMDIMLPGMSGLEATRRILSERPEAKILVLSNHSGPALIQAVFDAGSLGYVCKNRAYEELIPAIKSVGARARYPRTGAH